MKYKAIISDLDGTLLNSEHKVSKYTKNVIQKIVEKGIKFFIATGRHHLDASSIKDQLELDTVLISSNGARVHLGEEELFSSNIQEDIAKEILQLELLPNIHTNVYQGDQWLVEKHNEELRQFNQQSGFFYELTSLKDLSSENIAKIFFMYPDHEELARLQQRIQSRFPSQLNVTFSLPHCLEVMSNEVSKGNALKKVVQQYDLSLEECIAFGDGLNDLEMLQYAGKGLIMGNAHDKLKEVLTDQEVILPNTQDGVARYLEKLLCS